MMDFDVLTIQSNVHMETQFIYKRMALPKDSVDVDGLTLTLTDKRTHGNVGLSCKSTNVKKTRVSMCPRYLVTTQTILFLASKDIVFSI